MELSATQEKKLRHMLGATHGKHAKSTWGFRNYWCATKGGPDYADLREMEVVGLVKAGHEGENLVYFHATEAGCRALGLTKAQIARAFES